MQEKIWKGICEETIDGKISSYLRSFHIRYQQLQEKEKMLLEQYPVFAEMIDGDNCCQMNVNEHQALKEYLQLRDEMEQIERQYHFYYGQAMAVSNRWTLSRIRQTIDTEQNAITEKKDIMLTLLTQARVDEAEQEFLPKCQEYREQIQKIQDYHNAFITMDISKEMARFIEDYIVAIHIRYGLLNDFLYRYGMQDAIILLDMVKD